jgi:hypothetical protein
MAWQVVEEQLGLQSSSLQTHRSSHQKLIVVEVEIAFELRPCHRIGPQKLGIVVEGQMLQQVSKRRVIGWIVLDLVAMLRLLKMQQMYSRVGLAALLELIRRSRVQVENRQALLLLEGQVPLWEEV